MMKTNLRLIETKLNQFYVHCSVLVYPVIDWVMYVIVYLCFSHFNGTRHAFELLKAGNYADFNLLLLEIKTSGKSPQNYFMEACKYSYYTRILKNSYIQNIIFVAL